MKESIKQRLPSSWDEKKIRALIEHYDNQTDEQWAAEDEAAFADPRMSVMSVHTDWVLAIAQLIEDHEEKPAKRGRGMNGPSSSDGMSGGSGRGSFPGFVRTRTPPAGAGNSTHGSSMMSDSTSGAG